MTKMKNLKLYNELNEGIIKSPSPDLQHLIIKITDEIYEQIKEIDLVAIKKQTMTLIVEDLAPFILKKGDFDDIDRKLFNMSKEVIMKTVVKQLMCAK